MKINNLPIFKEDKRGIIYDCGDFKFLSRKKGSISADHLHDESEVLFLIDGNIELTVNDEVKIIKEPVKIEIPKNVYHKIKALTNIKLIYQRKL